MSLRQEALTSLPAPSPPVSAIEIDFRPDPSIFDGRYANNPWLQELPKPITKITWDNAVLLAPSTAARLSLANEDVVELAYRGRRVHGPVFHGTGPRPRGARMTVGYRPWPVLRRVFELVGPPPECARAPVRRSIHPRRWSPQRPVN